MRRIINRLILFILIISSVFYFYNPIKYFEDRFIQEYEIDKSIRNTTTYLIPEKKGLTFSLQSFSKSIKFITTASILIKNTNLEDNKLNYSIEYEFINLSGKLIDRKIHHYKTSIDAFCDDNNKIAAKNYYLDDSLKASLNDTIYFQVNEYTNLAKIRIKIHTKDENIADIGIRTYQVEKVSEDKKDMFWQRMFKEKKEFMSRGNIYNIDFMTKEEKNNLVSSLWKPMGPLGNENEDYKIRKLFMLNDVNNIYPCTKKLETLYASEKLLFTRLLQKGKYNIKINPDNLRKKDTKVSIKLYIGSILKYAKEYTLSSKKFMIPLFIKEDGLLKIKTSNAISFTVNTNLSGENLALFANSSKDYYTLDNKSLTYKFFSKSKRILKIETRSIDFLNYNLIIKMKDKDNALIKVLNHKLEQIKSKYDYIKPFIPITEATYVYIPVPRNIKTIDITSSKPSIIKVSTRVDTYAYPLYSRAKTDELNKQRISSWFSLRALDFNSKDIKQRQIKVFKQKKHLEVNPFIIRGKYSFEQLFPLNKWQSKEILLHRNLENKYIRSQSWSSIYSRLSASRNNRLKFNTDVGLKELRPRLIYNKKNTSVRNTSKFENISIFINNEEFFSRALFLDSGTILMPSVLVKEMQNIKFMNSGKYNFYISNTASKKPIYNKKQFILFNKALTFTFDKKQSNESLGFQMASTHKLINKSSKLDFSIKNSQLNKSLNFDTYTFKKYKLNFENSNKKAINISNKGKKLFISQSVYLKLASNLKNGKYTFTIYPPKNTLGNNYLYINHLLLNNKASTRISKEKL